MLLTAGASPAVENRSMEMDREAEVLEIVMFRPIPGADLAAMHAASQAIDPMLRTLPGFISRHTGVRADGAWVDVLRWRSMADAEAAMAKVHQEGSCAAFFAFIDPAMDTLAHYTVTDAVT